MMILQDLYPVSGDDASLLDVIGGILESVSEIEDNQLMEIKTKAKKKILPWVMGYGFIALPWPSVLDLPLHTKTASFGL